MESMNIFAAGLLEGRVALVTGGATGLGFAIAQEFARLGAKVVLAGRKQENLDKAIAELHAAGAIAIAVQTDVRQYDQVMNAVKQATTQFGSLDILVNSAAGNFHCPTEEMSPNGWRTVVDIDLNGTFLCCKAAFEPLRASRFDGRIISIITTNSIMGWPGQSHAGAAKAGILSLSRSLAIEWAKHKILVNTISPGPIAGTEGVKKLYEQRPGQAELQVKRVALGRLGETRDIANAAVYLVSPAGNYITGADFVVDGGRWLNYVANAAAES
jgi:NAD(P)-dependent dehydrogenase (short-subunit alcohol dehydrogenase family)